MRLVIIHALKVQIGLDNSLNTYLVLEYSPAFQVKQTSPMCVCLLEQDP